MKGGLFLTFEGGEGAGKTTLIQAVFDALVARGYAVVKTREPGGSRAGEMIRELLLHRQEMPIGKRTELLLFLADRAQHVEEIILPALDQGRIVLCDRYSDSTLAYQGGARGFSDEQLLSLCRFATDGLKPLLTLYLDLDPRVGLSRVQQGRSLQAKDRIESEEIVFHERIRHAFQKIAKDEPKRFKVIDASRPFETVYQQAMSLIDAILPPHRQ